MKGRKQGDLILITFKGPMGEVTVFDRYGTIYTTNGNRLYSTNPLSSKYEATRILVRNGVVGHIPDDLALMLEDRS